MDLVFPPFSRTSSYVFPRVSFSIAAVVNFHKLHALPQHTFIISLLFHSNLGLMS